jgi:TonB family protein
MAFENVSLHQCPNCELKIRTSLKISAIALAIALFMGMNTGPQVPSFEMEALMLVQQMLAFDLDTELPKLPFAKWFNQIAGPQAGVVWQLVECGERINTRNAEEPDLPACVEANATLPSGTKMIVAINVGSFKKGLIGKSTFFGAVIESKDRLYPVPRLSELPRMLSTPENEAVDPLTRKSPMNQINFPEIRSDQNIKVLSPSAVNLTLPSPGIPLPDNLDESLVPLPPPILQEKVQEGVVRGNAIIKVKPLHPESAKKMNAYGPVEVQIIISQEGNVIEATAISGHLALRNAAVEAARKWVFKPTTVNGLPVKVESTLTFVFTRSGQ